ncbi:uncharacterized protein LOC144665040 [Oculina patagonica]
MAASREREIFGEKSRNLQLANEITPLPSCVEKKNECTTPQRGVYNARDVSGRFFKVDKVRTIENKKEKNRKLFQEGFRNYNVKRKLQFDNETQENEPPTKRMTRSLENAAKREEKRPKGSRLMDMETLTEGLKECSSCHRGPLSLTNIVSEEHQGLASILNVTCNHCKAVNTVKTSKEHRSGWATLT